MPISITNDVPLIAIHKNPKIAVTIFDLLYTARTRRRNRNEVAGTDISKNAPMAYSNERQLAIGATGGTSVDQL